MRNVHESPPTNSLTDLTPVRLLLAEDDPHLRDAPVRGLREQSFSVDAVGDGDAAVVQAAVFEYDAIIVLDVLMPGLDGISVCRELRRRGLRTPVLLLTALDAVDDRIEGLDAGAYVLLRLLKRRTRLLHVAGR